MPRYIDADKLTDYFKKKQERIPCENSKAFYECLIQMIENQSTADVEEVKHGEWVSYGKGYDWMYQCSNCGWVDGRHHPFDKRFDFCPNCGAKMDGGTK